MMSEPIRLSKRLAEQLSCSRREAEQYIEGGWVLVDGQIVEEPQFKVLTQTIELHPDATLAPREAVTLLLHAPPDINLDTPAYLLMPAASRWEKDTSGIRMLKSHFARLTYAAVIEPHASGLVVFTQDWRVLRKLTEDAHKNEHEYIVEVSGELAADGLALLNHGLRFGGWPLPPSKVSWQNETRLRFAAKNPKPGQISHMCESVGLHVISIKRIRIGGVVMGKLQPGQWRYLGNEKF